MTSEQPSRRSVLRAAAGLTVAAGATALGGRATAAPASLNAVQATLGDKITWWEATSVAGPAVWRLTETSTVVSWRGDRNSGNLTVANLRGTPGRFAGSALQKTILPDSSGDAPSFGGLTWSYGLRLAWSGTNGGRSINVATLGLDTTSWTLTGRITGRTLVAGDLVSCTTGPAWGTGSNQRARLVVANQYGNVVVAEENAELSFGAPATMGFLSHPRGAVQSWYDGVTLGTLWAWTASDGALTFASVDRYGTVVLARSAQTSPFAPSSVAYSAGDSRPYLAWTTPAGRIAVAQFDPAAIRQGVDPIGPVTTLAEQSLASPALVPRPYQPANPPRLDLFWTGVDGTGALNAAVITF
jgi:hypothetical protein